MARISYTVGGQTSCTLSVTELNTTTTYNSIYITCNGRTSGNLAYVGSKVYTSRTWTITSLSAGTQYYAGFNITSVGGNTAQGGTYFTTESAPAPIVVGGVGSVRLTPSASTEGMLTVTWSYATNAEYYAVEVYSGYSSWGSPVMPQQTTYSNTINIYGLTAGSTYTVKVYGKRSGSNNGSPSENYTTMPSMAVGGVGSVRLTPSASTEGMLTVTWSYATNATYYAIEVYSGYNSWGNIVIPQQTTYSNTIDIYGLTGGSTYTVKVYGKRLNADNGSPSENYTTMTSFTPAPITMLSVVASTQTKGRVSMSWGYVTNATSYRWEIYAGENNTNVNSLVTSGSTETNEASYSSLAEYAYYTVKVYGKRGNTNGTAKIESVRTKDLTKPVLSNVKGETIGKMYLSFSASDAHSGLRTTSRYYTEISSKNGSTYGQGLYSNNAYRTFTTDASGNEFEQDAQYYMRVTVYDNDGNSASSDVRIQYKKGKPNNWAWHTTKTKGNNISLTADEWNSFCLRINQFRQYKGLTNYSFTNVYRGGTITALIVNQARSAILAMSPPSSVPPSAISMSTEITASHFNTLGISLNSIQ